ncbi:MAG: helix-turn-helix transcriptional regulator [Anaerolineales bacterium]|nr:helix-turn-helix transcriptional regulator [Anaerolineales bacterium]
MVEQQRRASDETLRDMARYFAGLKDVMRLRIMATLASAGAMTVTELARTLHASQPLISFHLRPLRVIGLVKVRRTGREVHYSLNLPEVRRRYDEFVGMLSHLEDKTKSEVEG